MDPQHPEHQIMASPPENDMATAVHAVGIPRPGVPQGMDPDVPPISHASLTGTAKDAVPGSRHEERVMEDAVVRESWASFASTAASRDSAVPSIFSVRASTASASTRYSVRQSLMESPISGSSPMLQEHRKNSVPQGPRYFCTFCDAAFDSKTEWKLHEFELHDRRERYPCRSCRAMFPRATLLEEHLREDHSLDPALTTGDAVKYAPIRSAWGCGFCATFVSSRNDYLDHVGRHYDEGKDRSDWQHTRVIEGLLHQPKVEASWMALVSREERAKGTKLRIVWTSATTGRTMDLKEPLSLQDMLEFFATGTTTPDEIAEAAYRDAQVRHEGNVSDLISKLYLRNPQPSRRNPTQRSAQPSPELHPASSEALDETVSPISPLPPPLRPLTAPPRPFDPSILNTASPGGQSLKSPASQTVPFIRPRGFVAPTPPHSFQPNLRRVESSRTLKFSKHAEAFLNHDRRGESKSPQTHPPGISLDISPISLHPIDSQPSSPPGRGEWSAASTGKVLPVATTSPGLSVRPHTSSSTLSAHTVDGSQGLGDSTSDRMSDESVSEPESWLEADGIPAATRIWKSTFQQRVDRGMGQLWDRFNLDWDALVRQYVGDRSGGSGQYRDSGRVRKSTSSRHAPGKGLHPNARLPHQEDERDKDEEERYRPPSSMSKPSSEPVKRFACPFRKHDPHTYNIHTHEVCGIRSWSTISRLKEHLYRRHYKTHCQRCKQTFSDAKELASHEMSVVACEVLDLVPPGDITTYQEKQLKSRKHTSRRQTDEEKWRDIYRLLFPDEEIPSPYPEPAEDMVPTSSKLHASLRFQHFLLSEMPTLFTKTAEEHAGRRLQARDALPMDAVPRIIEDALHKAFRSWEARGSVLPTREASVASMSFLPETPTSLAYSYGQVTAYQTPQPIPAPMNHSFPQGHFGNAEFPPQAPHASQADDSGFGVGPFFTSGPPINFNSFAPDHYERGPWEANLGLMGTGAFNADMSMGGQFRGFQNS
ncbi:hypothetical protein N657DRAFT_657481 [Parathielavia appendiculata]|uniref:C2H2-type domain-containing protein n=1 Tax=Parathielavia appendiculata TaxID=2587402 RepID=A0AAN6TWD6_9PEZI|nr:hypothetical protein N657DRAFT_657481 [Parathielavia appendiculata]